MINRLYSLPVWMKSKNIPGWKFVYKVNKVILNKLYPLLHKNDGHCGIDESGKMIVSLTTFPARIETVWITISSLMNQTMKPKKIILWLAKDQFQKEEMLPAKLLQLKKRGLEIAYCEDLKPHKKYYYTMQQYPTDVVVTADDDIFYPENHLEMLWKKHEEYPEAVCCWYAHELNYTQEGHIALYHTWRGGVSGYTKPSMQIMAVGCGGVLYPAGEYRNKLFNLEDIRTLCPVTDDIWLKAIEVKFGIQVVRVTEESQIFYGLLETRKSGLFTENANKNGNDTAIRAVMLKYPDIQEKLFADWQKEPK